MDEKLIFNCMRAFTIFDTQDGSKRSAKLPELDGMQGAQCSETDRSGSGHRPQPQISHASICNCQRRTPQVGTDMILARRIALTPNNKQASYFAKACEDSTTDTPAFFSRQLQTPEIG